jgi:hypothetical protein
MRLTPRHIAQIRAECGKGGLDAALLAAQLLEMVEKLQAQLEATEAMLATARRDVASAEAALVEQRLEHGGECQACHDAQARAVLERLRAVAAAASPSG